MTTSQLQARLSYHHILKLCKTMQTSLGSYRSIFVAMSEICRVLRMALEILSGCPSSEENDKQSYHDIHLTSMTHHNYLPCYNKVVLLCFATLITNHMLKLQDSQLALLTQSIFLSCLSGAQYSEASWWPSDVRCMPENHNNPASSPSRDLCYGSPPLTPGVKNKMGHGTPLAR